MPAQLATLIDEVRRSLGNRTDIPDERYIRWINWSLEEICGFHKKRLFTPPRFSELEQKALFTYEPIKGNCTGVGAASIQLAIGAPTEDGAYSDMVISVGSEDHLIVEYDGGTRMATLDEPWTLIPDVGAEYTIYRRSFSILDDIGYDPLTEVHSIERMEFASTGSEIEQVDWKELLGASPTVYGVPSKFGRYRDRIVFDTAIEDRTAFRVYMYMYVPTFSGNGMTEESPLPDVWDEVIIFGATYRGFMRLMEPEREIAARETFLAAIIDRQYQMSLDGRNKIKGLRMRMS